MSDFLFQKIENDSVNRADSGEIIFGPIPWEFDFQNFAKFLKMRGWRLYAWVSNSQNHPECSTFYADPGIHPIYSPVHLAISKDRPYHLGTVNFLDQI